jgi:hypothetical protein
MWLLLGLPLKKGDFGESKEGVEKFLIQLAIKLAASCLWRFYGLMTITHAISGLDLHFVNISDLRNRGEANGNSRPL